MHPLRKLGRTAIIAVALVAASTTTAMSQGLGDVLKQGNTAAPSVTDSALDSLKSQLAQKNSLIGNLQSQLSQKDGLIGGLKSQLTQKDRLIGGLKSKLTDKEGLIGNLQKSLTDKDGQLKALQDKLAAGAGLGGDLEALKQKLSAAEEAAKTKEQAETQSQAELAKLKQQNDILMAQVTARQANQDKAKAELDAAKRAIIVAEAKYTAAASDIKQLEMHRIVLGGALLLSLIGLVFFAMRKPKAA
jgi:chromosome segregation ATPase